MMYEYIAHVERIARLNAARHQATSSTYYAGILALGPYPVVCEPTLSGALMRLLDDFFLWALDVSGVAG